MLVQKHRHREEPGDLPKRPQQVQYHPWSHGSGQTAEIFTETQPQSRPAENMLKGVIHVLPFYYYYIFGVFIYVNVFMD